MENHAFIDSQNLHLSTLNSSEPWKVDLYKFRKYLAKQYKVSKAYYFVGYHMEEHQDLYNRIQDAGFILVFRAHSPNGTSGKKGNVDTDIVFTMMKEFHEQPKKGKFILVSGDGDYFKTISYLNGKHKVDKILFPSRERASWLYHRLPRDLYDYLDYVDIRKKIEYKKRASLR